MGCWVETTIYSATDMGARMKYKFKVGDKVTCTAGYYKFANGVVFRLGNGDQPFYFIEWETRNNCGYVYATSWSHENHLVLRGNFKNPNALERIILDYRKRKPK